MFERNVISEFVVLEEIQNLNKCIYKDIGIPKELLMSEIKGMVSGILTDIKHSCGHTTQDFIGADWGMGFHALKEMRANLPCQECHEKMLDEIYTAWI